MSGSSSITRRDFNRLLGLAGFGLVAGCRQTDRPGAAEVAAESQPAQDLAGGGALAVLHDFEYLGKPGTMARFFEQALSAFNDEKGVETESVAVAYQDLLPRMQSFNASRTGASAMTYYSNFNTFQFIDFLQPLDDLVGGEEEMSNWRSRIRTFNGQTHFSPYIFELNVLVANREVLDSAGLELPDRFESWEEFLAAIDTVVDSGQPGFMFGASDNIQPGLLHDMSLMEVLEDPIHTSQWLAGQRDPSDPIARIWIDRLANLAEGDRLNKNRTDITHAQAVEEFGAGAGAFCNMFKAQATALDPDIFTVIPFWKGTGALSATIEVAGDGFFITNYGENVEAAGEFIRWLHQPPQLDTFYETTGEFPCDDRFQLNTDNPLEQSIYDEIRQTDPAPYWPSEYVPADIVVSGINPLGAKILGGQSADEAFNEWTAFLAQWRDANVELNTQLEEFIAAVEE